MNIHGSIRLCVATSIAAVVVAGCGGDQERANAAGSDVAAVEQLLRAPSDALVDKLVAADVAVPGQPASDGRIFKGVVGRPTCRSNPSEGDQRGYRIDCELTKASTFLDEPVRSLGAVKLIDVRPTGRGDGLEWSE